MSNRPARQDGGMAAVLRSVSFSSAVFSKAMLSAPWAVSTKGVQGGIFHAVVSGHASIVVDGVNHNLVAGDAVFLPQGSPHVIRHRPHDKKRAVPIGDLPAVHDGPVRTVVAAGDGPTTDLLCATFSFGESEVHPLFNGLAPVWLLRGTDDDGVVDIIRFLAREVSPEAKVGPPLAERLAESLVLVALRKAADAPSTTGWLRGLSDPQVSRALSQIHEHPDTDWTMEALAKTAGLSRSSFCARFKDCTGQTPANYLVQWRMHLAFERLRGGATVGEVAAETAYSSEAAFSKAFKRVVGKSPGACRAPTNGASQTRLTA